MCVRDRRGEIERRGGGGVKRERRGGKRE